MSLPTSIAIEALRLRAGLAVDDASKDVQLEACFYQALSICEGYCDRFFLKQATVETIAPVFRYALLVSRWPIESVASVSLEGGGALSYRVNAREGMIRIEGGSGFDSCVVDYVGGFDPLPPDLLLAISQAFDAVWLATPGGGAVAGQQSAPAVTKVSVVGVGSFDVGANESSAAAAGLPGTYGLLPMSCTAILQRYLNHTVIAGS